MAPTLDPYLNDVRSVTNLVEDHRRLVILLSAIGGSILLQAAVYSVLQRIARNTEWTFDETLVAESKWPTFVLFPTLGAKIAWRHASYVEDDETRELVHRILTVLLLLELSWLTVRVMQAELSVLAKRNEWAADQGSETWKKRRAATQISALRRLCNFFVVFGTLCAVMFTFPSAWHFGLSMMASAGAAGVVLGLAARPGLQNVISALIIAGSHGMTLDDELVVENEFGRVEDIKSQYVVFRIWDGRRMILPLSYFTAKPFQNWTKTSTWKIGTVFFYFDPLILSRMDHLREQVVKLLTTNDDARRLWDGKVFCAQVTNVMQDGGVVEVRVLASAAKGGDAFDLRCLVREHVIAFVVDKWPDALVRSRNEARMFADETNVWNVGDPIDDDADAGNSKAVVEKEVFEHAKGE